MLTPEEQSLINAYNKVNNLDDLVKTLFSMVNAYETICRNSKIKLDTASNLDRKEITLDDLKKRLATLQQYVEAHNKV